MQTYGPEVADAIRLLGISVKPWQERLLGLIFTPRRTPMAPLTAAERREIATWAIEDSSARSGTWPPRSTEPPRISGAAQVAPDLGS